MSRQERPLQEMWPNFRKKKKLCYLFHNAKYKLVSLCAQNNNLKYKTLL